MGVNGYSRKVEVYFSAIQVLREKRITIDAKGNIRIPHLYWKDLQLEEYRPSYPTFSEAIRSLRHIQLSLHEEVGKLREVGQGFASFHEFIISANFRKLRMSEEDVMERFRTLAEFFSNRRTENHSFVRLVLKENGMKSLSLEELLEQRNWGAACAVLAFLILPSLRREYKRIIDMVPVNRKRVNDLEELLKTIWKHKLECCDACISTVSKFRVVFDSSLSEMELAIHDGLPVESEILQGLVKRLHSEVLGVKAFQNPFDWEHKMAVGSLQEVVQNLQRANSLFLDTMRENIRTARTKMNTVQWALGAWSRHLHRTDSKQWRKKQAKAKR